MSFFTFFPKPMIFNMEVRSSLHEGVKGGRPDQVANQRQIEVENQQPNNKWSTLSLSTKQKGQDVAVRLAPHKTRLSATGTLFSKTLYAKQVAFIGIQFTQIKFKGISINIELS